MTAALLKLLVPLASRWAERQEGVILQKGVPLTTDQIADALQIGILQPERVRLLAVEAMPWPLHPLLREAARRTGLLSDDTIGLTVRYGIFIRSDWWGNRRLIVHELAHTAQYERLKGVRDFLQQYLRECLEVGYPDGDLEQEARAIERRLCATSSG
jgi:hypothetical protein